MKSFRLTLSAPERRVLQVLTGGRFPAKVAAPAPASSAPPVEPAVSAPSPSPAAATVSTEIPAAPVKPSVPLAGAPVISAGPQLAPDLATLVPGTVKVRLNSLCELWPDPVRRDIAQFNWDNAWVSLPMDRLEPAMKTGRVAFKWGELIEWLDSSSGTVATSHCETVLQLPLKVIAPLFMAQERAPREQKNIVVDDKVPNLFAALGKEIAPVPPNRPVEPEPAVEPDLWSESEDVVSAPPPIRYAQPAPISPRAPSAPQPISPVTPPVSAAPASEPAPIVSDDPLGRILGLPAKTEWSPEEITQQLNCLPGVSGSLIAMSDGFLVAGTLPSPLKSETMAAFLPQIFGRLSNYSGEIQLGPLTALTLRAGPAPVTIFKTGDIYLTVMGKPGFTLPDTLLQQVAVEIAKRN